MKQIVNQEILNPFTEAPFQTRKSYKKADEGVEVNLTTARAIRDFLQAGFAQRQGVAPATMNDSVHALRVLDQIKPAETSENGTISIEDADYDWLIDSIKSVRGVALFGINTKVFVDAMETFSDGNGSVKE
jgi:hypothetical protein